MNEKMQSQKFLNGFKNLIDSRLKDIVKLASVLDKGKQNAIIHLMQLLSEYEEKDEKNLYNIIYLGIIILKMNELVMNDDEDEDDDHVWRFIDRVETMMNDVGRTICKIEKKEFIQQVLYNEKESIKLGKLVKEWIENPKYSFSIT